MSKKTLTAAEMSHELDQYTGGGDIYFSHLWGRNVCYTEGFKFFITHAGQHGARWFFDTLAAPDVKRAAASETMDGFGVLIFKVEEDKSAGIYLLRDYDESKPTWPEEDCAWQTTIEYTDVAPGIYKFYAAMIEEEKILFMVPREY